MEPFGSCAPSSAFLLRGRESVLRFGALPPAHLQTPQSCSEDTGCGWAQPQGQESEQETVGEEEDFNLAVKVDPLWSYPFL